MISLTDVSVRLGDRVVLDDFSVRLSEQRIGIIGANGSGKSTLARLFNALVLPTKGKVEVDGLDSRKHGREIRKQVGFIFTDPDAQIVMPTVAEDLAFSLRRSGLDRKEISARVDESLHRFGLAAYADQPAHLLSGGEKQLLAIAGVLLTDPKTLVCDEPTTLLDLRNARLITDLLNSLPQQVILVTHHLDLLAGYDRVLVIHEGRLTADDEPTAAIETYRKLMAE